LSKEQESSRRGPEINAWDDTNYLREEKTEEKRRKIKKKAREVRDRDYQRTDEF
jgi:hypothetical protein